MPEFIRVITKVVHSIPKVDHKQLLLTPFADIPVKSKLLRTEAKQGAFLCVFGVYHSPEQFVTVSRSLKHPFDDLIHVPDLLLQCIFDCLTLGPLEVSKRRIHTLLKWKQWAEELKTVEASIHANLPDHLRTILAGKRFALLERIATEMQWPDTQIHDELVKGFRLVGVGTKSNIFREDAKPAALTEEELMIASKHLKPKLISKLRNAPIAECNAELNQITAKEAGQKNWLEGPFSEQQIDQVFDSKWLPVERFAVRQKDKLRPIDNFASNRVNEAWSNVEKIDLHALDQLRWTISVICKAAHNRGCVEIPLKDGSCLIGEVHRDWSAKKLACKVTALDMKDAYKQLGIHASERCRSVVSLRNDSEGRVDHYLMNCLPFGAVGSVHHFNRLARLLWGIGLHYLMLPWVNYFDDFPLMSPRELLASTLAAAKALFKLLGFEISVDKLKPFEDTAEVLGVVIDCEKFLDAKLTFRMKESRRTDLLKAINEVLDSRQVIPRELPSFLGRIQFAEGQLMGRTGKLAMADIREVGLTSAETVKLDPDQLSAFELLQERFATNRPKVVALIADENPILVYTDGSSEDEISRIGGVLIDGLKPARVFGARVPPELIDLWHRAGKKHVIGQVEMYALVVARRTWKTHLHERRVIFFIDNWAVLDSYIPGTSKESTWRALLYFIEKDDLEKPCYAWATRVPSESNVADPPSRGTLEGLEFLRPLHKDRAWCPILQTQLQECC